MLAVFAGFISAFGLGLYDYSDNIPASIKPPGNLTASQVPQFIVLGFDDNPTSGDSLTGGIVWILDYLKNKRNPAGNGNAATFDNALVRATFLTYTVGFYEDMEDEPLDLMRAIGRAYKEGHEIGNHSFNHATTNATTLAEWESQIDKTNTNLAKPVPPDTVASMWDWENPTIVVNYGAGVDKASITGWRTPSLAYNAATFTAIRARGFTYDCSIEDGWEDGKDGTNFTWPYTLNQGSAGSDYTDDWDSEGHTHIGSYPGVWELPQQPFMVPASLAGAIKDDDKTRITGLDYNIIDNTSGDLGLKGADFYSILCYTLDCRLKGNRAPLMIGGHSQFTTDAWAKSSSNTTGPEIRKAWADFIEYALKKPDVRFVRAQDLVAWCRKPVALSVTTVHSEMAGSELFEKEIRYAHGSFYCNAAADRGSNVRVSLYRVDGTLVQNSTVAIGNSAMEFTPSRPLLTGCYILKVGGKKPYYAKMIISR